MDIIQPAICVAGQQHPILRRERTPDKTRFIGTSLTAELVVVKVEHFQRRQSTEGRRNWTYGTEGANGQTNKVGLARAVTTQRRKPTQPCITWTQCRRENGPHRRPLDYTTDHQMIQQKKSLAISQVQCSPKLITRD